MTDAFTVQMVLPEIILIGTGTLIYLAGAFFPRTIRPVWLALLGIVAAGIALVALHNQAPDALTTTSAAINTGPIVVDLFGYVARWAVLIAGGLLVILADRPRHEQHAAEYTGSIVLMVAGLMLSAIAHDLVLMFAGLELVSIPTYVVLYLGKRGPAAQEATAKYFFLSILSSALLLYGFSYLYGIAGSTLLPDIATALRNQHAESAAVSPFAAVSLLLLFAGLGFRMTAVPFHFYAPDVYQGTSNPNAGLLSTLPKFAGLLVLVRIVLGNMPGAESLAWKVALAISVLTMTLGNVVALWQHNIRRLLAYSSIAHGGYMLIGVAVGLAQASLTSSGTPLEAIGVNGIGTALFYVSVYTLATLGTFAALAYLGSEEKPVDHVDELAGISHAHPAVAAAIAVFMFSLAGIPPVVGFWGKFTLMSGAIDLGAPVAGVDANVQRWFFALAIIAVVNAAIAAAYYLRVVAVMYFARPAAHPARSAGHAAPLYGMVACLLLVIAAGLLPGPIMQAADHAGASLSQSAGQPPRPTVHVQAAR